MYGWKVSKALACPKCGERNIDKLPWCSDKGVFVRCDKCGKRYNPNAKKR